MVPHCSAYSRLAFERFNPVKAWLLTADRLLRCGHDLDYYESITVAGHPRFIDSLELQISEVIDSTGMDIDAREESVTSNPSAESIGDKASCVLTSNVGSSDSLQWGFANQLMMTDSWIEATIEFKRLLWQYPMSSYCRSASLSIFLCYMRAEEFQEAAWWGLSLIEGPDSVYFQSRLGVDIARCYLLLGNYRLAFEYLSQLEPSSDMTSNEISFLQGIALVNQHQWDEAGRLFKTISKSSKFSSIAVDDANLCRERSIIGNKSATKAGILSIVPGLGYYYAGYRGTAISSFLVNGLFILSTYEAFSRDNVGAGVLLSVLSIGWYTGNIYGAVASVQRRMNHYDSQICTMVNFGIRF